MSAKKIARHSRQYAGVSRPGIFRGVKFVKRAGLWCFYKAFNDTKLTDVQEWFNTKEDAQARLEMDVKV